MGENILKLKAMKAAFPATIPVMLGYLFMGIAFGILMDAKGFSPWWSLLMAATVYCGSMQFVAIGLLCGPFDPVSAVVMTLLVNARHIFYGLSTIELFRRMPKQRPYLIFSQTDETFSLHCAARVPAGVDEGWYHFFLGVLDHCYWITGCTAGALAGMLLKFNTTGIEFVMTALFVVIFVDQWQAASQHVSALTGLGATLLCLVLFGKSNFLIPAMLLILGVLTVLRPRLEGGAAQ